MAILVSGCHNLSGATGSRRQALEQLKSVPKFEPGSTVFYTGAATEKDQQKLEHAINNLIDNLLATDVESLDKQAVLKKFKTMLDTLDLMDSEDQDRVCFNLEKIMDIFHIESSDGLLSMWRYGFDPDKVKK